MTSPANTTTARTGPFWDSVLGRSPLPPAAATGSLLDPEGEVVATAASTIRVIAFR